MVASEEAARHFAAEEAGFDDRQICLVEDGAELDLFPSPVSRHKSIGRLILENNRRIRKNGNSIPSSRPSAA